MTGQTPFTAALLDGRLPVPDGLTGPAGQPATRRFAVYRNNVAVALTEALETAFPVLRRLLGDDFFKAMAHVHLRAHPPRSPLMMHYGADMPRFLREFRPVAQYPYLPDIARIELALRASYHAADAPSADPATLGALPPDRLTGLRLHLAPSLHLIRSRWPIHAIFLANSGSPPASGPASGPAGPLPAGPQSVLVTRPVHDPRLDLLSETAADLLDMLIAGAPLGAAVARSGTDPAPLLTRLFAARAVTAFD